MMEIDQLENNVEESARLLRLDIKCLKTIIANYAEAELRGNSGDSTLRSWARELWVIGSNVLLRSDPNRYSIQLVQILSQYGIGWIPVNLSEISAQGSLWRSLSLLSSHGLICMDVQGQRIKIKSLNLMNEIQEKSQFDVEMIQDLLRLLNSPRGTKISRSRHVGLTSTLNFVLNQSGIPWSQEFHSCFDEWVSGLLDHPSQELNDEEKWVMSAGIELLEGVRSLRYRSLEILFLLRSGTENLDLLMSKAMTYMNMTETALGSINPPQQLQINVYVHHFPNYLNPHDTQRELVEVVKGLRKLNLTTQLQIQQLTVYFMSGWNSWKHLGNVQVSDGGYLGSVSFAGLLDCLNKQGKMEEILTLVRDAKEYLSQGVRVNRFQTFFPELVMSHVNSLDPSLESAHHKQSVLIELESYLMCIYRVQVNPASEIDDLKILTQATIVVYVSEFLDNNPRRPHPEHRSQVKQGVLPYLFNCLAQLGRYQTLQWVTTDMGSHLRSWTTDITINSVSAYAHIPGILATSVKDLDFPIKETLFEDTFRVAETLVKMTLGLGTYENIRKLRHDPMEALINFCFETKMVHELTGFLGELEVSLVKKYGENRVGPITTTLLYFGERVTDGLERAGPVKMANCDWSGFLEQVKCCVLKWTQLISTPPHEHEKKSWMDGIADLISRKCDM